MKNLLKLSEPAVQALLALLVVFFTDIFVPLGVAVGVLYIFCFFLVCRQSKKVIIAFAIVTSLLTVAKLIIFLSPAVTYMAFINRGITVSMIITIALLALRHRTLIDHVNEERNRYVKQLEDMLFITSHRVRKPLVTCMGLMELVETDKPLTEDDLKKIVLHLKSSALELDKFTKELTTFVHNLKEKGETKLKPGKEPWDGKMNTGSSINNTYRKLSELESSD